MFRHILFKYFNLLRAEELDRLPGRQTTLNNKLANFFSTF